MVYGIEAAKMVSLDRVFLDTKNPRHEPFKDEPETIKYLCEYEQILPLAEDISKYNLNPLELFALISEDNEETYYTAEGNRRLCALLLLNDPSRAPFNLQKKFAKAAENWEPISSIFAVVFKDRNDVQLWLDRIHAGPEGGRGRRSWNSEQKARNTEYDKNDFALAVLDEAQRLGYININERRGRISTVQKYLANPELRRALGLVDTNSQNIEINISEEDFSKIFKVFMRDIANKHIDTRTGQKADSIVIYAKELITKSGISGCQVEPRSLASLQEKVKTRSSSSSGKQSSKPQQSKEPTKIPCNLNFEKAIKNIPSFKLERLYHSLVTINLEPHTPLLYVAAWSLIETLTNLHGSTTNFQSYLSNEKLVTFGYPKGDPQKSIRQALQRISEYGNSTKHHHTAAGFNSLQLVNDMDVLTPLLCKMAKSIKIDPLE